MNSLFLGLIAAGIVLVAGIVFYNWLQERHARQRVDAAFKKPPDVLLETERVEPAFRGGETGVEPSAAIMAADSDDELVAILNEPAEEISLLSIAPNRVERASLAPDADIECVARLAPAQPVSSEAVDATVGATFGKPVRWLARHGDDVAWQALTNGAQGEWREIAACMLLANRAGAASRTDIDNFLRRIAQFAASTSAAFAPPDGARETGRAEELDRFCADLDVQIGLTILIADHGQVAGTRLRGVAEAAGFRLNAAGHFDYLQDEGGAVLYSMQNFRQEPFTAESLRALSTPGVVLLLDVPRVADPVRVFDHMRLAAKRIAHTLEGVLVDDNRRQLNDASLAAIRAQVLATATALRAANIEPGGPRAQRLFG